MITAKEIAYAFYLVLTTGEDDVTHVWRLFQFWYKRSPDNREAFREIERIHGPKRHAPRIMRSGSR